MAEPHPFDLLECTFRSLCNSRRPLSLPGDIVGSDRRMDLYELRESLLCHGVPFSVRDAVLGDLVRRASTDGEPWGTGIAGVLLPGLRAKVGPLARAYPWLRGELESEAILGLLDALPRSAPTRPRIASRLIWAARTRAARMLTEELADRRRCEPRPMPLAVPHVDRVRATHADIALGRACGAGILTRDEAELIGETRISGVPTREYAERVGEPYGSVRMRRLRAERRLADWIYDQRG